MRIFLKCFAQRPETTPLLSTPDGKYGAPDIHLDVVDAKPNRFFALPLILQIDTAKYLTPQDLLELSFTSKLMHQPSNKLIQLMLKEQHPQLIEETRKLLQTKKCILPEPSLYVYLQENACEKSNPKCLAAGTGSLFLGLACLGAGKKDENFGLMIAGSSLCTAGVIALCQMPVTWAAQKFKQKMNHLWYQIFPPNVTHFHILLYLSRGKGS